METAKCGHCSDAIMRDDRSPSGWLHIGAYTASCNPAIRIPIAKPDYEMAKPVRDVV